MPRHGFARNFEFEIQNQTESSVVFVLESNAETFKSYPFEFKLQLEYQLEGNSLKMKYSVENKSNIVMPFSLGAHPAFAIENSFSDYSLQFNQAIMEFGALQCVPKNPDCTYCVLNDSCIALQKKKVAQLPVKMKKTKVTNRFFNYLIFSDEESNTIISKRTAKGIWHNLYEFPLIETDDLIPENEMVDVIKKQSFVSNEIVEVTLCNPEAILHKLSHQHLTIRFWEVKVQGKINNGLTCESAKEFPFPIVIFNFISKFWVNFQKFTKFG